MTTRVIYVHKGSTPYKAWEFNFLAFATIMADYSFFCKILPRYFQQIFGATFTVLPLTRGAMLNLFTDITAVNGPQSKFNSLRFANVNWQS